MIVAHVKKLLDEHFPQSKILVIDDRGDGYHLTITVASKAFAGKSRVQQHQMVYNVFKEEIDNGTLHAVTIKTQESLK